MYKIIGADQKEYGPITEDQLRHWIAEGRINGESKVQAEGSGVWKKASEFPEFATALASAAPLAHTGPIRMAPAPVAQSKTNLVAIWSMVTGIIALITCCGWILGPLPIVLGCIGLSQLKNNPQQIGSGYAIAGIVLGVVCLILLIAFVVICLSAPDLLPNMQKALQQQ